MSMRGMRLMLGGLLVAAAMAALPDLAAASISPGLTLDQSAGTIAGSTSATGFGIAFNPTGIDSAKDITISLAPGLLADASINGGACLASSTAAPACQVGAGTATKSGSATAVSLYLVKAPKPADLAGVQLVLGPASVTGDLTLRTTPDVGQNLAFSGLPAGISALSLRLTNLRLPTNCPTPAAQVAISADSQLDPAAQTTSAPLTVTGCSTLRYAPSVAGSVTKQGDGALVNTTFSQTVGESASRAIELDVPDSVTVNGKVDAPCLEGSSCVVGTASITSPLLPVAIAGARITISGSFSAAVLTVAFPPPLGLSLVGNIDLKKRSITFANMPDLPITSLAMNFTGTASGPAFKTGCQPTGITAKFTPQDGNATFTSTTPVIYHGCPPVRTVGKPTASGSLTGLAAGHPRLRLKVVRGTNAPGVKSLSVRLPKGLTLQRGAIITHHSCTKNGNRRTCRSSLVVHGASVSGGSIQSVALQGGAVVITLKRAVSSVTLLATPPLLAESKALAAMARAHKLGTVKVTVTVTDEKGARTTIAVSV